MAKSQQSTNRVQYNLWCIYYSVIVGNEKSEGTGKDGDDWFQINVIIVLVDR